MRCVLFALLLLLAAPAAMAQPLVVSSPDSTIRVTFSLSDEGPRYQVDRLQRPVVRPSRLGVALQGAPPLGPGLTVADSARRSVDETWEQPWGETRRIRNRYNELRVLLEEPEAPGRQMAVVFRAYDDGVGFRYEWPEQAALDSFVITDEQTEFAFAQEATAWHIPAFERNRYEYLYERTPLSEVDTVHTPITMETADGLYLSVHEAALTDYSSMALARTDTTTLQAALFPWADGTKVKASTPHVSPWRTLQIGDTPGELITSYLILNLNEPNALGDVSWVDPGTYIGVWWAMHLGEKTWESGPDHGATTENVRRYIDFAAEHGFDGVLVEGWNTGWDGNWIENGSLFSFTEPYPDFALDSLAAYAQEQGTRLIGHHETSGGIPNYEAQMADAFALYDSLGVRSVKTGYVDFGQNLPRVTAEGDTTLEWHHGQYMVRHYRAVTKLAAEHEIMLNVHEPIKPTGIRRTYPNLMTREGARGQEYNSAQGGGNGPAHTTILPFTRMLAGPMDFTPGIFDLDATGEGANAVPTTLAKQLALYVVLYSPLQMAADLPENYEARPDAFQFIKDVPADWDTTLVLHAAIGDYVTTVRKDRNSDDWYLGSITDEVGRTLEAPLYFLAPGQSYVAEIYADAVGADWETNATATDIRQALVTSETVMNLRLAPGGGQAIRFRPATDAEAGEIAPY